MRWSLFRIAMVLFVTAIALALAPQIMRIAADSLGVDAGNVYYAQITGRQDTLYWAGLKIQSNGNTLSESNTPIASLTLNTPVIAQVGFPGTNFKDGLHWYAATFASTFKSNDVLNMTPGDLYPGQLFAQSEFPAFYPNYTDHKDNPNETFCCQASNVTIAGKNYTAYKNQIANGIDYYLLKYNNSGVMQPLFLVNIADASCYNATSCVGEFMLPITNTPYNFFAISKLPAYTYDVYIDGVPTKTFSQTGLPYNLTLVVKDLYSGAVAPGVNAVVAENNGQNIFVPYRLSGYVSTFYSVGKTDSNGRESFLVAPTEYPTIDNYSIYIGALQQGYITSPEPLSIANPDSLVRVSKPLSPSTLYDNAKTTTNAINQINSYLFTWSSQLLQAYKFTIQYDIGSGTWTVTPAHTTGNAFKVKTGAPNVVTVYVTNGGVPQSGYHVRLEERGGFLVMNPYTGLTPLDAKQRIADSQTLPTGQQFIITPTSLGAVQSNITLQVLNSNNKVVASLPATINSNLNINQSGVFYNNDLLKTITNSMNQVVNSIFHALNF